MFTSTLVSLGFVSLLLTGCGGGTGEFGDPCCTGSADECEQPDFGGCAGSFNCHVIPHGPYTRVGFCSLSCSNENPCPTEPAGATCVEGVCMFVCDTSNCSEGYCLKGENCPAELTCRDASNLEYCMP